MCTPSHPSLYLQTQLTASCIYGREFRTTQIPVARLLLWLNFVLQCLIILELSVCNLLYITLVAHSFEVTSRFLENLSTPKRTYSKHYFTTLSTWELMKSAQIKLFMPEFSAKGELNVNWNVKLVARHFSQICHCICKHYIKIEWKIRA